jgi:hypothetical protein
VIKLPITENSKEDMGMVIEKPKNVYLPYASMITSELNEDEPPLKYFNT